MTARIRSRLTYANVVATVALFLAVAGGVAVGATQSGQDGPRLAHKLKVVKQLVKEVESQQDTSDQQTLAKLDVIDNRIVDLHLFVGQRFDTALARLRALCKGQNIFNINWGIHDDRTPDLNNSPKWGACIQALLASQ